LRYRTIGTDPKTRREVSVLSLGTQRFGTEIETPHANHPPDSALSGAYAPQGVRDCGAPPSAIRPWTRGSGAAESTDGKPLAMLWHEKSENEGPAIRCDLQRGADRPDTSGPGSPARSHYYGAYLLLGRGAAVMFAPCLLGCRVLSR